MAEFEVFTGKGSNFKISHKASVTINSYGKMHIPTLVRRGLFDGAEEMEYLINTDEMKLGFRAYKDEEAAPDHAYKIDGDEDKHGVVSVANVIRAFEKQTPNETKMFEILDQNGVPYINVSDLPEMDK